MSSSRLAGRAGFCTKIVVIALAALLSAGAAQASEPMITGGLTSQPIGHYDFCKLNASECSIRMRDMGPERMTGSLWNSIIAINASVNTAVRPMSDYDIYGKDEVWAYPDSGVGDCEDYVLEKRRALARLGVSLSNLLITVVRKPDGEGHAVLTVRTTKGDFVLDNLNDAVKTWDATGYRFLKRQSSEHTGRWVIIREGPAPMVSSVE